MTVSMGVRTSEVLLLAHARRMPSMSRMPAPVAVA
jgi:hypothetical protein